MKFISMHASQYFVQGDFEYDEFNFKYERKSKASMQKAKEILKVIEWVTSAHV